MTKAPRPTRANHFVPQAFQLPFSTPEKKGEVWRYDKQNQDVRLIPIRVNAVANDLYTVPAEGYPDDALEHGVFERIENFANPVLAKLVESKNAPIPSMEDRRLLSVYIAALMLRVPRFINAIRELTNSVMIGWLKENGKSDERIEKWFQDAKNSGNPLTKEEIREFLSDPEKYFSVDSGEKAAVVQGVRMLENLDSECQKFHWSILTACDGSFFCTSDNPVILFGREDLSGEFIPGFGIGHAYSEIHLPISPQRCLYLSKRSEPGAWVATKGEVSDIQRRSVILAERFVFAPFRSNRIRKAVREFSGSRPQLDPDRIEKIIQKHFFKKNVAASG